MAVTLSYDKIAEALASNPTFILTTLEDPKKVKSKLAQAKFRAGIKGRLNFSTSSVEMGGQLIHTIEIALLPAKEPSVQVLTVNPIGDL